LKSSIPRLFSSRSAAFPGENDETIRSELFSVERLEQHAESLAAAQRVTAERGTARQLAPRLRENGRVLLAAYRAIGRAIRDERAITPAAEWLVDNFHIAEEQIREIHDDLPRGFYRELPKLAEGPLQGYPRVFGIAWAYVAHTDSLFDPQTLSRFVRAYQRVQPLTIGELWAVAITLRIVLVENLRRAADRIVSSRAARQEADALADRLLQIGSEGAVTVVETMRALEQMPLSRAFAVQLVQRLRDQDPAVTPALLWLDERLAAQGTNADDIVRDEHQRQGTMNVTVRNVITSMRLMSDVDWADFFESVSLVDEALRADSDFDAMDFATRDHYRHAIETLARGSALSEIEVAERALRAAHAAGEMASGTEGDPTDRRRHDPGYYLIGDGKRAFGKELGFRGRKRDWLARRYAAAGLAGYLGSIAALTAILLAVLAWVVANAGAGGAVLALLSLVAVLPASDAAMALINRHVTNRFGAKILPGLELRGGVPPHLRTMVAVPMMLTSRAAIEEQVERLEVHYLASPEDDLHFAMLSDWTDADAESAAGDDALLAAAADGIARLNERYPAGPDGDRFLLLHRRRVWSESESKWIGWERKRGKLHELNRLLRGAADTTFLPVGGEPPQVPSGVRYVITLDADTRLPHGVARRLVGKLAHPLNRAKLDARTRRVVEGYGVLQPRVSPTLPIGRDGSLFQRVFSGPGGMDPYAAAVSDVYQDLFGEGSYTGKGIYDVDAFEAALDGRVPEGTLLSHDLLEGVFARAALVSDIEVFEEFPARYDVAAARQHRWARGDWQLLPWILGRAPATRGSSNAEEVDAAAAAVPPVGRWKMIDNLRRTLSPPTTFLALVIGWTLPLAGAVTWTAGILALMALPALLPTFAGLLPPRIGISKRSHARALVKDLMRALVQVALVVSLLAHQAWLMGDAIARTLYRLFSSRRNLLEWLTAAQAVVVLSNDRAGYWGRMVGAVALGGTAAIIVATVGGSGWPVAVPFVAAWVCSPLIARLASRPPRLVGPAPLADDDATALRVIARRTWRFFETFVTSQEHMLPPDNFQEQPNPVVAHRTSPSNIGLYLLSVVAARDFGWIGTREAADRIGATLDSMEQLERFRGHFYNWYDTRDLRPLEPKYVSSVDSGNLAGHLIALGNACREMIDGPVINPRWRDGIEDAVALTRDSLDVLADDRRTQTVTRRQLNEALSALSESLRSAANTPGDLARQATELVLHGETIVDIVRTFTAERGDEDGAAVLVWAEAVSASVRGHAGDVSALMPWAKIGFDDVAALLANVGVANAALRACTDSVPTLADLPARCAAVIDGLAKRRLELAAGDADRIGRLARIDSTIAAFECSASAAVSLSRHLAALDDKALAMSAAMDFEFLYDPARQLLSLGYQVAEGARDETCYDLLASEARLASFIAIAKGDVPVRHWFRLGRALTPIDRSSALISWSGSMFEYLMPSLVMRAPAGSLLEQTSRFVVRRQISYGAELGTPWGISESAYNVRDREFTYQYSSFGVPGLGLKRGLSQDAVIAPYATALAAMVDPHAALQNFTRLAEEGGRGSYGYFEALDFTPRRRRQGATVAIVRCYMAHHQGMSVVAIANALQSGAMRRRFHAEPIIQATELLLQERTPRGVAVARPRAEEVREAANVREILPQTMRRFHTPHGAVPRTHLLSNGRYAVMLTAAGSGYSRWGDIAITRWREDMTCDDWGSYVFLRDVADGAVWSAGYQPTGVEPDTYEVEFAEGRAEIVRRDGTISTTLKVAVSAEAEAEVRHLSIANLGNKTREIELTSYAEVVLAPAPADAAHPAFSKLFVQTEFVEEIGVLLATRRRRSPGEPEVWAVHLAVVEGEKVGDVQFETDRARFLGRGRDIHTPIAMLEGQELSNSVGNVLDPIFSLRCRIRIPAGATARVAFWTLVASTREEALDLADKHRDPSAFDRALTLAWTQAQVQLHYLGCAPEEAYLFQRLASHLVYANPTVRPSSAILKRNDRGRSTLWAHGISGDLPIVLVQIEEVQDLEIVRQLLRAHHYWRMKGLAVDLVILNERSVSYAHDLQSALEALVRMSQSRSPAAGEGTRGSVFVLRADHIAVEVCTLLQSAARAVLVSRRGNLSEQLKRLEAPARVAVSAHARSAFPRREHRAGVDPPTAPSSGAVPTSPTPVEEMEFFNGLGGFARDGREYVTVLGEGRWTPAPWINVVANPSFGFQTSVEGGGYTWSLNSREHQLTAWVNDPVGDRPSEVLYLRDEDSGVLWCPTPLPIRDETGTYVVHHGQGYSRFEHSEHGMDLELTQFVPLDDAVKISRLVIRNRSRRTRRLSVTAYVEWVLGPQRAASAPFVTTEIDSDTRALLAHHPWSDEWGDRVAFTDLAGKQTAWTGDRTEFIGRHGSLRKPAALAPRAVLSNRIGAGLDPCGVLQTSLAIEPNGAAEIVFLLGDAPSRAEALSLVTRYRGVDLDGILRAVEEHWDGILGTVQVKTPDRAMDIMLNRWLLYQTLACRVVARSAFYQASGAYGFRDQLQDGMALAVCQPRMTREHIVRAAARQFIEGDVQHWWLPETGRGVRTRFSDDLVWLAYATAHYLQVTGDHSVLDVMAPFLEGPALRPGEHDLFFLPMVTDEEATVFEHCAKALDRSLAVGEHGLPLMGVGDWNDGMNRVGEGGRGESVWLAWFLHATLSAFAPVARKRGEVDRASAWEWHAEALRASIEREAWDGDWYRRGYYDDGTPLGSASSDECRIDSIAQSWGVISGAADPARAARAMAAVGEHLVRDAHNLLLLFTPPFDQTPMDPGYIKGYPPGVRENGGQYTHASTWTVIAVAMLGDGDRAAELFAMLNPINHSRTRASAHRYKVEPYVVAADIYSVDPHLGRGGWTWYTGSSGWLYRAGLEWILGFRVLGDKLIVDPCIPKAWPGFEIVYRHGAARYEIAVENPAGVCRGVASRELDGAVLGAEQTSIELVDDGATHRVRIVLG